MYKNVKKVRTKRGFSLEFKKELVRQFEKGDYTILQLCKLHGLNAQTLYNWVYKYSNFNEKNIIVVEMKNSSLNKVKELERLNTELSSLVGRQQLELEFYKKLVEAASEDLQIDLKKNISMLPLKKQNPKSKK
jgi:transposase